MTVYGIPDIITTAVLGVSIGDWFRAWLPSDGDSVRGERGEATRSGDATAPDCIEPGRRSGSCGTRSWQVANVDPLSFTNRGKGQLLRRCSGYNRHQPHRSWAGLVRKTGTARGIVIKNNRKLKLKLRSCRAAGTGSALDKVALEVASPCQCRL